MKGNAKQPLNIAAGILMEIHIHHIYLCIWILCHSWNVTSPIILPWKSFNYTRCHCMLLSLLFLFFSLFRLEFLCHDNRGLWHLLSSGRIFYPGYFQGKRWCVWYTTEWWIGVNVNTKMVHTVSLSIHIMWRRERKRECKRDKRYTNAQRTAHLTTNEFPFFTIYSLPLYTPASIEQMFMTHRMVNMVVILFLYSKWCLHEIDESRKRRTKKMLA